MKALADVGHNLTILTRQAMPATLPQAVEFCRDLTSFKDFNQFDAAINLAGEPIFNKAWTADQKKVLVDSTANITAQLLRLIKASSNPPHTFISR